MATTISYTNYFDQPITDQQLSLLNKYNKIYKEDNIIKKVEYYEDGVLNQVNHYKKASETINDILNMYVGLQSLEIRERSIQGLYLVENVKVYYNGEFRGIYRELFDENNNIICFEDIDNVGNPIILETEKHLYDVNNEKILSFCYKEDGSIKYVWGFMVGGTDRSHKGRIYLEDIPLYFPNLLTENPYYVNSNFLP